MQHQNLYDYCVERGNLEILDQWNASRNEELTPRAVAHSSHKKVWWICSRNHEWKARVYTRAGAGEGCPYCAGKKLLPGENDLAAQGPSVAAQWHPTKNAGTKPDQVFAHTSKKAWWICEKGHEWMAAVSARMSGEGCPVCSNHEILQGENDLATTHPSLVTQWHPEKNGPLTPAEVVAGSIHKVWWKCARGHEWCATIASRAHEGTGCPVCAGKVVIPGENDLASAFPEIAAEWNDSRNGALTPQKVSPFSNRKVWWTCSQGHDYQAAIGHRSGDGSGCPYCAGRKVFPGFNDLATLDPVVAAQWHPTLNGSLSPESVTLGSHKKVWWMCSYGHVWKAVVYSRARGKKHGCPFCAGTSHRRNTHVTVEADGE